jgi:transposase
MPKIIQVRKLSEDEKRSLEKLSRSGLSEKRMSQRAEIILRRSAGEKSVEIAQRLGLEADSLTRWVKRFNEKGLEGLKEQQGRGRKPLYSEPERGQMLVIAQTKPEKLGLPFASWSIRRLVTYLNEQLGLGISRAQLACILETEGLRWYQEQTYFTERPDPQFVEKRGRL